MSPSRMQVPGPYLPLSLAVLLVLLSAPGLLAQERDTPAVSGDFHGVVLDSESGHPVHGVEVYLPDRTIGYLTREDGRFRIPDIPAGALYVEVRRIGYADLDLRLDLEDSFPEVEIHLPPNPVVLEGFEVVVDRFERRRRSAPTSIRVVRESELKTAPAMSAADMVFERVATRATPCPAHFHQRWCVRVRGRPVVPVVYIDESPALGGVEQLATYRPQDFYMVEVYGSGRHVRAYTHHFMERAARNRLSPIPLFFF
jgi:hypothetical protein